jgi:hypothetical protein
VAGVGAAASLAGLAVLLRLHQRPRALDEARLEVVDAVAESDPGTTPTCEAFAPCLDYPRLEVLKAGFAGWPLLLTMNTTGLAALTGELAARRVPPSIRRSNRTIAAGSVLLGLGAAAWLAGSFRKPSRSCFDGAVDRALAADPQGYAEASEVVGPEHLRCFERWFDVNAALVGSGAGLLAIGTGLLVFGLRSRTDGRVSPELAVSPRGFHLGFTIRL